MVAIGGGSRQRFQHIRLRSVTAALNISLLDFSALDESAIDGSHHEDRTVD